MFPFFRLSALAVVAVAVLFVPWIFARETEYQARWQSRTAEREAELLAQPFRGISIDGEITPGLFSLEETGVSTEPVVVAGSKFVAALSDEQRAMAVFPVDDSEWRKWNNMHAYFRQGVSLATMNDAQKRAAMTLLGESLSPAGMKLSTDIMHLNHTLGELNSNDFDQYGDELYWFSMLGTPSSAEPWGWQLDGHHLIINYFVLRDQVVMSPVFVGSEPVIAESGKYAGTAILQDEQDQGLGLMQNLTATQQAAAVINTEKDFANSLGAPFKDNLQLESEGVSVATFSEAQRSQLLELIALYIGNLRSGHAAVRMAEIERFLGQTVFAWIGAYDDDAVYYYRITSPVVMIEFDHMGPVGLRHLRDDRAPNRQHIHAVVRTPNGNDYGKDLLRQHYEQHPHTSH